MKPTIGYEMLILISVFALSVYYVLVCFFALFFFFIKLCLLYSMRLNQMGICIKIFNNKNIGFN